MYVRSTNLDLRTARNVWAAPADCEFQKSLVRGAEVLRRSRGWGPRRPEEVFARRRDLRRPCRWGISRREDFEVVGRGGDAWRKGSCPALGAAPRHSLAVRRGSVLGGQAWLGPPGSGSINGRGPTRGGWTRPCCAGRSRRLRHRQLRKRRPTGREHRIPARFRTSREISQGEYGRRRLRLLVRTLPV